LFINKQDSKNLKPYPETVVITYVYVKNKIIICFLIPAQVFLVFWNALF